MLEKNQHINISVIDIAGRSIKTLVDEVQEPNIYHKKFNLSDLAQGVYFIEVKTSNQMTFRKITLVK